MALKDTRGGRWWSRLHFAVRFTGVTAVLVGIVGLSLVLIDTALTWEVIEASVRKLQALAQGQDEEYLPLGLSLLQGGVIVGAFWLLLEALIIVRVVAGRRSAFGFNAIVQLLLATALLLGVNVYSSQHFCRFDLTIDHKFTLPTEPVNIPAELAKLHDKTTILVFIRHKSSGQLSDKSDPYESAAERKIVEKVRDLAEQFHEFGPQFKVEVLDVQEKGYAGKFRTLAREELQAKGVDTADGADGTKNASVQKRANELRTIVESAPENSIFFLAGDRVQRMSFNDVYQLDKTASRNVEKKSNQDDEDDAPGSNLVLLSQGVIPFARKALDIDQRKPRIGVATIHELLSTEGPGEIGHNGLKKALVANGFEVRDIILKRENADSGELEPAVYTYAESRSATLKEEIDTLKEQNEALGQLLKQYGDLRKRWESATLDDLTKEYAKQLGGQKVTERLRQRQLESFKEDLTSLQAQHNRNSEQLALSLKEKTGLSDERLKEQQRLTDLKAKLERQLADVDLLIVPRTTILSILANWRIRNDYHHLDKAQVDAIRDFVAGGKPLLAFFGPTNEPGGRPGMPGTADADELEKLLGELGIEFGKSVVLYNVESKGFAARRSGLRAAGLNVDLPSVAFEWSPGVLNPDKLDTGEGPPLPVNPLAQSMRVAERSVGKALNLSARHARPIGFDPKKRGLVKFDPVFMVSSAESWNDDNPFPTRERSPHYEKPKPDDRRNGTFDQPRLGPFPIGVAIEETLPASWYSSKDAKPATVRVAVIGDGSMFVDRELTPAREKLLVNLCNWLMSRDDRLPSDAQVWEYPRVDMSKRDQKLWNLGAWFGLPLLFFYVGLVVFFVRRLR